MTSVSRSMCEATLFNSEIDLQQICNNLHYLISLDIEKKLELLAKEDINFKYMDKPV